MMRAKTIPILLAATLALAGSAGAQSAPDLVNYQGTLLQPNGAPELGPKTLEFRILDEGNAVVWGPQTFEELPLQNGKFNVLLGQADNDGPFVSTAFAGDGDAARYLSVKIADESTERLPLQRIASVPFAERAAIAESLLPGVVTPDSLASLSPGTSASVDMSESVSRTMTLGAGVGGEEEIHPDLRVTIVASGKRPVLVGFRGGSIVLASPGSQAPSVVFGFFRDGDRFVDLPFGSASGVRWDYYAPPSMFWTIDFPSAGERTYTFTARDEASSLVDPEMLISTQAFAIEL